MIMSDGCAGAPASKSLCTRIPVLREATAELNTLLDEPERLYSSLLDLLGKAVPFSSGSLQVMDGDEARIIAFRGPLDPDVVMGLRFRMDPLFPNYRVVMTRSIVAHADIRIDYPHFLSRQEEFNSGHIRSWLGVPLIARGVVIGMFALDRDQVDPFSADDISIVQSFADQAAVALRNARIMASLHDAVSRGDALMREMNHRVKNSLQLVSSLIGIQEGLSDDAGTRDGLSELRTRIGSISAIHERLYRLGETSQVDLGDYLLPLAKDIIASFRHHDADITVAADLIPIRMDTDIAMTLGLIIAELVMNAIKYAFSGREAGTLTLSLGRSGHLVRLTVTDDGPGIAPGHKGDRGFGLSLVHTLAEQIGGHAVMDSDSSGTTWSIEFDPGP